MPGLKTFFAGVLRSLRGVCVLLICSAPVAAQEQDALLVLDLGDKSQAGFLSALRIQLGSAYSVRVSATPAPERLPERLALATELMESEHAFAAVWIEDAGLTPERPRSAVLYVVGRRAGRALLEVVHSPPPQAGPPHAPGARGLALERMLAIKLDELLAELRAEQVHPLRPPTEPVALLTAAGDDAAASERAHTVPPAVPARAGGRRWSGMLGLGPRFDAAIGGGWSRFGVAALLAPELSEALFRKLRVSVVLGVEAYPALHKSSALGAEVSLAEISPRACVSLGWVSRSFALALHTGPSWSWLSVKGTTPRGLTQQQSASTLGWLVGFAAEHSLWRSLSAGVSLELQASAQRLDFGVNDASVLDRGWLRLTLGIDLRLRVPIAGVTSKPHP